MAAVVMVWPLCFRIPVPVHLISRIAAMSTPRLSSWVKISWSAPGRYKDKSFPVPSRKSVRRELSLLREISPAFVDCFPCECCLFSVVELPAQRTNPNLADLPWWRQAFSELQAKFPFFFKARDGVVAPNDLWQDFFFCLTQATVGSLFLGKGFPFSRLLRHAEKTSGIFLATFLQD